MVRKFLSVLLAFFVFAGTGAVPVTAGEEIVLAEETQAVLDEAEETQYYSTAEESAEAALWEIEEAARNIAQGNYLGYPSGEESEKGGTATEDSDRISDDTEEISENAKDISDNGGDISDNGDDISDNTENASEAAAEEPAPRMRLFMRAAPSAPSRVELTTANLDKYVQQTYEYAHSNFTYGTTYASFPAGANGEIDCTGLILRTLYSMGYITRAMNCDEADQILGSLGFLQSTDPDDLDKHGFVQFCHANNIGTEHVNHTYYCLGMNEDGTINKYDLGSNARIRAAQPYLHCRMNEWEGYYFFKWFWYLPDSGYNTVVDAPEAQAGKQPSPMRTTVQSSWDRTLYCTADELNIRQGPGTEYPVLMSIRKNSEVKSDGQNQGAWVHVNVNGTVGYAHQNHLSAAKAPVASYSGDYYIASALNAGYVLDVANGSYSACANIQLYYKNRTGAQKFRIQGLGDGYFRIMNIQSGKVLDVANASRASGANIWQYPWNGTVAQKWKILDNGNGTITLQSALGTVLDNSGAIVRPCNNIWAYTGNSTKAQQWVLQPV